MLLGYLILAHLLGDFIFQPNRLVLWKMRSKIGVLVHVLIHFVLNLIILAPFIINGYFWLIGVAFAICFVHYWVDQAKINYDLRHDKKVRSFLIDQLLHLLTILLAYFFVQDVSLVLPTGSFYKAYSDIRLVIFFSFLVLSTTVVEVYHYQWQREKNTQTSLKIDSKKMVIRILVVTFVYLLFMALSFYARGR